MKKILAVIVLGISLVGCAGPGLPGSPLRQNYDATYRLCMRQPNVDEQFCKDIAMLETHRSGAQAADAQAWTNMAVIFQNQMSIQQSFRR